MQSRAYIEIRPGSDMSSNFAYVVNNSGNTVSVAVGTWEYCPTGSRRLPDRVFYNMVPGESRFVGGTNSGGCRYDYFLP